MQKPMLFVCALALAAVQAGAVGQLKKRHGSVLAVDAVTKVWYSSSCKSYAEQGRPHDFKPNTCHTWDGGISFRANPLTGDACTPGKAVSVSYWAANAACEGQATSETPIQSGVCTTVGPMSFLFQQEGVPDSAMCSFLEAMVKTSDHSNKGVKPYLYSTPDCSGDAAEAPNGSNDEDSAGGVQEPEPSSMENDCAGCCPSYGESGVFYRKELNTCGKDGIFQASADYSDEHCQNLIANSEMAGFMSACQPMGQVSYKVVVSQEFTSAVCSLVDLMKQHSFTDDEWTTPEGIRAAMPFVGDVGTYGGAGTLTISSVLLLLATCLALA